MAGDGGKPGEPGGGKPTDEFGEFMADLASFLSTPPQAPDGPPTSTTTDAKTATATANANATDAPPPPPKAAAAPNPMSIATPFVPIVPHDVSVSFEEEASARGGEDNEDNEGEEDEGAGGVTRMYDVPSEVLRGAARGGQTSRPPPPLDESHDAAPAHAAANEDPAPVFPAARVAAVAPTPPAAAAADEEVQPVPLPLGPLAEGQPALSPLLSPVRARRSRPALLAVLVLAAAAIAAAFWWKSSPRSPAPAPAAAPAEAPVPG